MNYPCRENKGAYDLLCRGSFHQLQSGKTPGADAKHVEVYKSGGLPMVEKRSKPIHCV